MPHELGVCHHGELALNAEGMHFLKETDRDLDKRQKAKGQDKRLEPFRVLPAEQPVHENAGEGRVDDANQRRDKAGEHHKGYGKASAAQPGFGKGQYALGLAARHKAGIRGEHQANAGKSPVKFLPAYAHCAPGRVIEHGLVPPKSAKHHKMVEIPVDDAGESPFPFQLLRLVAVTLGV